MRTKRQPIFFIIVVLVLISILAGCSKTGENTNEAPNLDSWVGEYEFSERCDPDESEFYIITIYKIDTSYWADIDIDGFQSLDRVKANISGSEASIDLVFSEYRPDNVTGAYQKGDILLSFEKKDGKLYTTWGTIIPLLKYKEPDICFTKVEDN